MTENGMTSRIAALCFDANDPRLLARFWAATLRWEIDDEIGLVPRGDSKFGFMFRAVPEKKEGQNPIHLDLSTTSNDDKAETIARLLELGAHHIDIGQRPDEPHVVLADPEGNEFCVLEPGNSFVDDSGRFGSVTCNGSPQVGYFWSEALGWPLVWDQDEETAIRAPDDTGPFITWGPPIPTNATKNRIHLDIVPDHGDQPAEVARLVSLGATPIDIGQGDGDWMVMADPDGNRFCLLKPG
jgi:predicted enzyme related to lactoylglutathione lyase